MQGAQRDLLNQCRKGTDCLLQIRYLFREVSEAPSGYTPGALPTHPQLHVHSAHATRGHTATVVVLFILRSFGNHDFGREQ
jgi:hypothetical protein